MIDFANVIASVGVAILGYIAVEVRGLRNDIGKHGERIARLEGLTGAGAD